MQNAKPTLSVIFRSDQLNIDLIDSIVRDDGILQRFGMLADQRFMIYFRHFCVQKNTKLIRG